MSTSTKDVFKDFRNLQDIFGFSNPDENHELFSIKSKKNIGKNQNRNSLKHLDRNFICLRSQMYSLKCGNDSKNKLNGIP